MKKITFIIILLAISAQAQRKNPPIHREHQAHSHGSGSLSIAFEKNSGKIEFKIAAESILGFEHNAKSEADKKILAANMQIFETEINKMIIFDTSLNCQFTKEQLAQQSEADSHHSDWIAQYSIHCDRSPLKTKLLIDFTRYKKIRDLDITLLVEDLQKNAEYKGTPLNIELK